MEELLELENTIFYGSPTTAHKQLGQSWQSIHQNMQHALRRSSKTTISVTPTSKNSLYMEKKPSFINREIAINKGKLKIEQQKQEALKRSHPKQELKLRSQVKNTLSSNLAVRGQTAKKSSAITILNLIAQKNQIDPCIDINSYFRKTSSKFMQQEYEQFSNKTSFNYNKENIQNGYVNQYIQTYTPQSEGYGSKVLPYLCESDHFQPLGEHSRSELSSPSHQQMKDEQQKKQRQKSPSKIDIIIGRSSSEYIQKPQNQSPHPSKMKCLPIHSQYLSSQKKETSGVVSRIRFASEIRLKLKSINSCDGKLKVNKIKEIIEKSNQYRENLEIRRKHSILAKNVQMFEKQKERLYLHPLGKDKPHGRVLKQ